MARITAPVQGYNGTIGDVVFKDGVAETDNLAVINYCRNAGYAIDGETAEQQPEQQRVDARDVDTAQVGTPLRDAAVDPKPGDFLAPINAGKADPHGPEVVSPGLHAVPPAPIVPGPVSDDPAAQDARESEVAKQVLVEGQPATTVAEPSRPPQSAPKAAWVDWAVSQGADRAEANATSKADLIEAYGYDRTEQEA